MPLHLPKGLPEEVSLLNLSSPSLNRSPDMKKLDIAAICQCPFFHYEVHQEILITGGQGEDSMELDLKTQGPKGTNLDSNHVAVVANLWHVCYSRRFLTIKSSKSGRLIRSCAQASKAELFCVAPGTCSPCTQAVDGKEVCSQPERALCGQCVCSCWCCGAMACALRGVVDCSNVCEKALCNSCAMFKTRGHVSLPGSLDLLTWSLGSCGPASAALCWFGIPQTQAAHACDTPTDV
ncbi:PREDICTED: uncharacterized protein LOC102004531 [Chinchilla lanigera]|uniref:uncharacterized protein LOC102004531 n=1 Tax=Chinchilla lanigera TaxID=34839 RepID=UPI00038EB9F8|nr:PREDICTED: uncharacterized protein LOC102004531 [Chinchilla lanigera]